LLLLINWLLEEHVFLELIVKEDNFQERGENKSRCLLDQEKKKNEKF
jgi:hypothetical protein